MGNFFPCWLISKKGRSPKNKLWSRCALFLKAWFSFWTKVDNLFYSLNCFFRSFPQLTSCTNIPLWHVTVLSIPPQVLAQPGKIKKIGQNVTCDSPKDPPSVLAQKGVPGQGEGEGGFLWCEFIFPPPENGNLLRSSDICCWGCALGLCKQSHHQFWGCDNKS